MKKLIIDDNAVYEVDLECVKRKKNINDCGLKMDDKDKCLQKMNAKNYKNNI